MSSDDDQERAFERAELKRQNGHMMDELLEESKGKTWNETDG